MHLSGQGNAERESSPFFYLIDLSGLVSDAGLSVDGFKDEVLWDMTQQRLWRGFMRDCQRGWQQLIHLK